MKQEPIYIRFNKGRFGNQLYYVLQAYIRSKKEGLNYIYSMPPRLPDGEEIYSSCLSLGMGKWIQKENKNKNINIHKASYMQIIDRDFSLNEIYDFISNTFLMSKPFQNINDLKIKTSNKIAIHIRNGDFINNSCHDVFNRIEYLTKAIKKIKTCQTAEEIVVFSDDINTSKELYQQFLEKEFKFVSFISQGKTLDDFIKLSLFKNKILWNSTFSYWSAFISDVIYENQGTIICPYKFTKHQLASTHINPRWTTI